MRSIKFACQATLVQEPELISRQILDLTQWPKFRGYGPIPGIESARFETQPAEIVGTRIRVKNRDGSSHVEEITCWEPQRRVQLRFGDFSAPVSRMAEVFWETWDFQRDGNRTLATRSFELVPKSYWAWPVLWIISFWLKGAIRRHLADTLREAAQASEQTEAKTQ